MAPSAPASNFSPDGQWFWNGREWIPAPPSAPPTTGGFGAPPGWGATPIIVREQKSVGQQVGNGIATFGLIIVVIVIVVVVLGVMAG